MTVLARDNGSFRDPAGYLFVDDSRVIRGLTPAGAEAFSKVEATGALQALETRHLILPSVDVPAREIQDVDLQGPRGESFVRWLEHPRVPFITYPYEWIFEQLRDAARHHLDVQLVALEHDCQLSDASAYNIQFTADGPRHIDVLSLQPYREGEPWQGYHQFCREFLFPLLLQSHAGLPFQPIYRSTLTGVESDWLMRSVPWHRRVRSLNFMLHVSLQHKAVQRRSSSRLATRKEQLPKVSRSRYRAMLEGLRDGIASLRNPLSRTGYWSGYDEQNHYQAQELAIKREFVVDLVSRWKVGTLADIGGNGGEFSAAALEAGARHAICLDTDVGALAKAYSRTASTSGWLSVCLQDFTNPSPAQGWQGRERSALAQRLQADCVLALALIHHLVIGRNVPLPMVLDALFDIAPRVIIEFVPKSDPMVVGMLQHRADLFPDYTEESFMAELTRRARVQTTRRVRAGGRLLLACERLPSGG